MLNKQKETQSNSKKKKLLFVLFGIVILMFIASAGAYVYISDNLKPNSNTEELKILEIPMGSTLKDVASILDENGIIKNSDVFYYYARMKEKTNLRAGKYQLSPDMQIDNILQILEEGKVYYKTVKFTIPEGYVVEQIAEIVEEKGLVGKEEFKAAANKTDYEGVWFLDSIPERDVKYKLEGFLFPKTYVVREDATAEDIVMTLLKQTEKEFPKEWLAELEKINVTFYDAITLASVIEREAVAENERPQIAQVYYNRLGTGMKLQADATIQYAFDEQKERLFYSDLEVDSKYNTYKYEGMPIGPIANPGIDAIKSAVFPEKHDYLFYVTKKDGTGEHYFSTTYDGHLANIEKSKKN